MVRHLKRYVPPYDIVLRSVLHTVLGVGLLFTGVGFLETAGNVLIVMSLVQAVAVTELYVIRDIGWHLAGWAGIEVEPRDGSRDS